ncbi:MAG: UDP-N-acetylmuramoyl-tripeptide--D-alanyl-D-alanine ligase [Deltaproteobacteria bacterium]|nr:UDP-N-acetylmuramoyl-tripeptide--D-alanyl-D-alanine ligase [Deltaproteobacteria bacterium]
MMSCDNAPIFTCGEIIKATGGVLLNGDLDRQFRGVSTDSRQTEQGNLFIALKGDAFDGHDFLDAAILSGAAGLVIETASQGRLKKKALKRIAVISVADTLGALGAIAHFRRKAFDIPVIGITGSAGKTTTKEMTAAIFALTKKCLKTEGNFNNLIGLPLTLLNLNKEHEIAVIEMGTNFPGEIGRLTRIAEPTIGLITNVGPAHLEGLKTIDCVREEKGDLFRYMAKDGIAVVNLDDENTKKLGNARRGRKVTFGLQPAADVEAVNIRKLGMRGCRFDLRLGEMRQEVQLAQTGEHHIYNALAAAAATWTLGTEPSLISRGLSAAKPLSGRMEIHPLGNGSFVINDAYNANPLSVRAAVKTLGDLMSGGDAVVILADMLELGEYAVEFHEEIGSIIAARHPAALFLKGDYASYTARGACKGGLSKKKIFLYGESNEVLAYLKKNLKKGQWILVKGSRRMRMDELVRQIKEAFGADPSLIKD